MDLRTGLAQLYHLRRQIEARMEKLPGLFNLSVKRGSLRLRAWRRAKGVPPYAVYWVRMNRRRLPSRGWRKLAPVFPFHRPKIRTRRDLDAAIFFGMVAKSRRIVYRFHAQMTTLNAAHAAISAALEECRKRLHPFRRPSEIVRFRDDFHRVLSHLDDFEAALDEAQTELQKLALEMRIYTQLPLRLVYDQDADHPYGRLRWRWVRDGKAEGPLTDRRKRALRLDKSTRREFTPFEQRRRLGMRRLTALTIVLRRLTPRVPALLSKIPDLLKTAGIVIPFELLSARRSA